MQPVIFGTAGPGRRRVAGRFLVTLLVALVPAFAASQETGEERTGESGDQEPVMTQEEVLYVRATAETVANVGSIATKLPLSLHRTPGAVSVVTRELFLEQDGVVLTDALKNVSGASLHTQTGVHDFFYLRGFDSLSGGLVLTDGAAEPEATFYQLYNVDRVEVLKGPGGFLYGGNPLSGTVNLVRKTAKKARFLGVGFKAGSFDTLRSHLDLNLGGDAGRVSFRLNGMWQESDNYRDRTPSDSLAVNPALTWWIDGDTVLRLNAEVLENDYSPDAGLPVLGDRVADVPRTRSYQSPFDFSQQQVRRFRVDYETALGARWTLREKAYATDLDWQSDGTLFFGTFPAPGDDFLLRGLTFLNDRQTFAGNQLEGVLRLQGHTLLLGLEVERNRDEFSLDVGILPLILVGSPVETATRPIPLFPPFSEAGNSRTRVVAPYVLERWVLARDVEVFLGARLDSLDLDERLNGVSRQADQLSPMLGISWAASPGVSLYANLGRGFAPPSTRVVGEQDPEESEQIEVGLKGNFLGGRLRSSVSLYQLDRDNIPIPDDNGFTAQQGSQRSRGVEIELAGALQAGLHYHLAYALTDGELTRFNEAVGLTPPLLILDRSGNTPAFVPEHTLNVWLGRRWRSGFGFGVGGRYVSEQFIAEDNLFQIDDALTFDASVSYSLPRWTFSVNGKNLTDEEYDTRGFGAFSVIPASLAAVVFGVDFSL